MAPVTRSKVTLRISADNLDPDEISRLLNANPTTNRIMDVRIPGPDGVQVVRRGSWHLEAPDSHPEDIDGQVAAILSQLTCDLTVWASIAARHKVDVFCGLFLATANEGFSLSPGTMSALASRGVEIGFDIYDNSD